jgi:hypothetical protein
MLECNNKTPERLSTNTNIQEFDFSKRRLVKGQWIDVKDTVNQWLEAQVIDVKDDKVYVHYNGWGVRWDEWIDMNSDRIRPFRYYTQQNKIYNYLSPCPNSRPDANISMTNNTQTDFFDLFDDLSNILFFTVLENSFSMANNLIDNINTLRHETIQENTNNIESNNNIRNNILPSMEVIQEKKNVTSYILNINKNNSAEKRVKQREVYYMTKNLVPYLDKLGRAMTDMGTHINNTLKNNSLEE